MNNKKFPFIAKFKPQVNAKNIDSWVMITESMSKNHRIYYIGFYINSIDCFGSEIKSKNLEFYYDANSIYSIL